MRKNSRKGFTLAEVVVAFSLIAIVFAVATSAVLMSLNVRRRTENVKFFVTETERCLECYKIGGSAKFEENVKAFITDSFVKTRLESDSGENDTVYKIYYTKSYEITDERNAAFVLEMTLNKSFFAKTTEYKSGKTIFALDEAYVSRFDM